MAERTRGQLIIKEEEEEDRVKGLKSLLGCMSRALGIAAREGMKTGKSAT